MSQLSSAAGYVLRFLIPLVILAVGGMAFVLLPKKQPKPRPPEKNKAVIVQAVPLEVQKEGLFARGKMDIRSTGVVVPYREIQLSAEVAGRVTDKAKIFRVGNYIPKGTKLLEVEKADYEIEVGRIEQELASAKVSLEELKVQIENNAELAKLNQKEVELQSRNVYRVKSLRGTAAVNESELDTALQQELKARNELRRVVNEGRLLKKQTDRMKANIELKQFELQRAQLDLQRTSVVAPVGGVVVEEMTEKDSYVTKGQSVAKIHDVSKAEVLCYLKPSQAAWLWESLNGPEPSSPESPTFQQAFAFPNGENSIPARIVIEQNGSYFAWQGRLDRYAGSGFEESTRTVPCLIVVDNPQQVQPITQWEFDAFNNGKFTELRKRLSSDEEEDRKLQEKIREGRKKLARRAPKMLMKGMFVDSILISIDPPTTLYRVPEEAVLTGDVVLKIEKDPDAAKDAPGVVKKIPIRRIQTSHSGDVLIDSATTPLREGDRIILNPQTTWYDGMAVVEKAATKEKPKKETTATKEKQQ